MEKISAACAMEWSMELEKGLRSRKHDGPIEAILQMGHRLEQWSREPSPSMSAYSLFGLVPGEDRLFANAILLRLADAFRCGDKRTRRCVLKVFLHELRQRQRSKQNHRKQHEGILSKKRVSNHLELLKRVKIVYDTGDVESRALALQLLGCWADFSKDSAEIRYMVLSSLSSCHDLEVKASLFAAGVFCEVSDDFGYVVLEILSTMVASTQTSFDIRLLGIRVFAKLGCSSTIARRAYKAGQKLLLLLESYHSEKEDRFLTEMLKSLSKLASRSMILIAEQVELLLSFIGGESTRLHVQDKALRCLHYLTRVGGVSCVPVNENLIKTLFHVLEKTELAPGLHCESLRILLSIFHCCLPQLPCMDMVELGKLVAIAENAAQSSLMTKTLLALRLLVEISCCLSSAGIEMVRDGDFSSTTLASKVILFVMDQINTQLEKVAQKTFCSTGSEARRECRSLLGLVLHLVQERPDIGVLVLDKIRPLVEFLVKAHNQITGTMQPCSSVHEVVHSKGEIKSSTSSEIVFCVFSFVQACLAKLDEASAITTQLHDKVKLLVEVVDHSSFFEHFIGTIYPLLLESHVIWHSLRNESVETELSLNNYWIEQQRPLEFAKIMLAKRDNWSAYRVAKYLACEGSWFAAFFTLGQLVKKVQSKSSYYWLKSLALFAHAECEIQLLHFPKQGLNLVKGLNTEEMWDASFEEALVEFGEVDAWYANANKYCEKLTTACSSFRSAADMLHITVRTGQQLYFQRWFLDLRTKVVEAVVDLARLLGAFPFHEENFGKNGQFERVIDNPGFAEDIQSLMPFLAQISSRLKRLAQEFDLLVASFMHMDSKSSKLISIIALNCSLLAFCSGFTLFFPQLHTHGDSIWRGLECSDKHLRATLIQNLLMRFWYLDNEMTSDLKFLSTIIGEPKNCLHLQSGNSVPSIGHNERRSINVCRFAVSAVIHLQKEAERVNDDGGISRITRNSLQLLSDILKKWMYIPFRIPKYFFQVRPCIGAELFACSSDTRRPGKISILPGFHLSLNLCLQLKNAPPDLPFRLTKLFCILNCKTSYQLTEQTRESNGQLDINFQSWKTDEIVDLNEMLLLYVKEDMKKTTRKHDRVSDANGGSVNAFVCFKPSDIGQGFSSCLLDVSTFPLGSYKIIWHSCCIDNQGSYYSLIPLNNGPVFTIEKTSVV